VEARLDAENILTLRIRVRGSSFRGKQTAFVVAHHRLRLKQMVNDILPEVREIVRAKDKLGTATSWSSLTKASAGNAPNTATTRSFPDQVGGVP